MYAVLFSVSRYSIKMILNDKFANILFVTDEFTYSSSKPSGKIHDMLEGLVFIYFAVNMDCYATWKNCHSEFVGMLPKSLKKHLFESCICSKPNQYEVSTKKKPFSNIILSG